MRVAIHQPEHMPWLGFFHKINMADMFVILDNVQYRKNYFQNRNKIRSDKNWSWLTVPVKHRLGQRINEIRIDDTNKRWKKKYWDSIYFAYKKAPFFDTYSEDLKKILDKECSHVFKLNIAFISKIMEFLKLNFIDIMKASELDVKGKGSELLLNICRKVGTKTYISGISGKEYLKLKDFEKAGIRVIFQEFYHPIYKQLHEPFIPCMSVMDLLFNHGDKSGSIINGIDVPVMQEVFF